VSYFTSAGEVRGEEVPTAPKENTSLANQNWC